MYRTLLSKAKSMLSVSHVVALIIVLLTTLLLVGPPLEGVLASFTLVPETAWTGFFRHNAIGADPSGTPYVFSEGDLYKKTSAGWVYNSVPPALGYGRFNPSVLVDHLNTVHVFYHEQVSGSNYRLYHVECDSTLPNGGSCDAPVEIATRPDDTPWAPDFGYSLYNSAVEDIDGNLHLVYGYRYSTRGLVYTKRSGGEWSTPTRVREEYMSIDDVSLGLDPDGRTLHVATNNRSGFEVPKGLYYGTKAAATDWSVEPVIQGSLVWRMSLVLRGSTPLIAYSWSNPDTGQYELKLATRNSSGGWTHEVLFAGATGGIQSIDAEVADGVLHVIFDHGSGSSDDFRPVYVTKELPDGAPTSQRVSDSGLQETAFVSMASSPSAIHISYNHNRTALKYLWIGGVPNESPVANGDSATTHEDTELTIDVAANDSDPNDNLDPTSATATGGPSNGTLVNHGDGTFTYTPDADFNGGDSFDYQICDMDGLCDQATVAITVVPVNAPPSVDAGGPYSVDEGNAVTVAASGSDPDGDPLTYDWDLDDDGIFETAGQSATFSAASLDGPSSRTISVQVTDGGGLKATDQTTVDVLNVAPTVDVGGDVAADEGSTASMSGSFTDPGADTWTATVDYGNGSAKETLALGEDKIFAVSHIYGDNGTYLVTVTVTDDDGGVGTAVATVTVVNLAPTLTLNRSALVSFPGSDGFVGRKGVEQSHEAAGLDPGSDDLIFTWSFGTSTTYYNNGLGPDPLPSPGGSFPFLATDTGTVILNTPGVHTIGVEVEDDDGSKRADSMTKLVVDNRTCAKSFGFWRHQFSKRGHHQTDDATLEAYLGLADFASGLFSERVPANTVKEARNVLQVRGPGMRDKAEAQLLAAWLNFAQGAVGWNELIDTNDDGVGDTRFGQAVSHAEAILLNADATRQELEHAKDLAEAVNECDQDDPACAD